jgi:hypothetical protein
MPLTRVSGHRGIIRTVRLRQTAARTEHGESALRLARAGMRLLAILVAILISAGTSRGQTSVDATGQPSPTKTLVSAEGR